MKAIKFNFKTKTYEEYELPKGSSLHEIDMNKVISCAECGKSIEFGYSYASRQIHTEIGLGYGVCEECYYKEVNEVNEAKENEK